MQQSHSGTPHIEALKVNCVKINKFKNYFYSRWHAAVRTPYFVGPQYITQMYCFTARVQSFCCLFVALLLVFQPIL